MSAIKAVAVAGDIITAYGQGADMCWAGLLSGKTAIRTFNRFNTAPFVTGKAAFIAELKKEADTSLTAQMLQIVIKRAVGLIPDDAFLILASTTGEIDYVEKSVGEGADDAKESLSVSLLEKTARIAGTKGKGMVVSAACASSSTAVAQAAGMIRSRAYDCVLVVA